MKPPKNATSVLAPLMTMDERPEGGAHHERWRVTRRDAARCQPGGDMPAGLGVMKLPHQHQASAMPAYMSQRTAGSAAPTREADPRACARSTCPRAE